MRYSAFLACVLFLTTLTHSSAARTGTGTLIGTVKHSRAAIVFLEEAGYELFDTARAGADLVARASGETVRRVTLDQKDLTFTPHVLVIEQGTVVDFINSDDLLHNIHVYRGSNMDTLINVAMPIKDMKLSYQFNAPLEVIVLCDVHPEMSAYILVVPNKYFSTAKEDGNVTMEDIEPGQYVVKVWKEGKTKLEKKTVQIGGGTNTF